MAKFLVVHPVGKEFNVEAATPFAKALKAKNTVDAYWIGTQYSREAGKLYCEFDAKDAESIKQVLTKTAEVAGELPTEGIYKIEVTVSSVDYR